MQRHSPTSHQDLPPHAFLRKKIRSGEDAVESSSAETSKSIFGPSEQAGHDAAQPDADSAPYTTGASTIPVNLAYENVAPFLARHAPEQYAPLGSRPFQLSEPSHANSKYCYRHRPDLKCRRQADEPSMEHLQRVCLLWPSYVRILTCLKGARNAPSE